jgi:putative cardiolipin synthase
LNVRIAVRAFACAVIALLVCFPIRSGAEPDSFAFIDAQLAEHPGLSGAYVLDSAEEALIARAWLADHAQSTIEVQYFIWSTDNIGILAADALLRAAERGVKVRIIVDDLLVDAPDKSLLALAQHPNLDIRIYNPKVSVGVPWYRRVWNATTDLRSVNQRMHDKTFIVDGKVAITGGRNMAAEYYDYHSDYNFRDRDALLAGDVVNSIHASFDRFWQSGIAIAVEQLYEDKRLTEEEASAVNKHLHGYAGQPENFAPAVRAAIASADTEIARIARGTVWGRVDFICDIPGKNAATTGFSGGGQSSAALGKLLANAKSRVLIQSPYLVASDRAMELFKEALARGVRISVSTNSLASTDNMQAFAGYRNQRDRLLKMGMSIFEYRPNAATQSSARARELVNNLQPETARQPIFGLHAKTMVIDSNVVFIGTFNLDPRSENLNTEVGAVIYNEQLATAVEKAIETDMQSANSWNAASDDPDQYTTFAKRSKVRFWQMMPIKPLL